MKVRVELKLCSLKICSVKFAFIGCSSKKLVKLAKLRQ